MKTEHLPPKNHKKMQKKPISVIFLCFFCNFYVYLLG